MKILEKGKVNGFLLTTITPEEKSEDEARQLYRKLGNVLREYINRIQDETKNPQNSKNSA